MPGGRFPRAARLLNPLQFKRVFRAGIRSRDNLFTVIAIDRATEWAHEPNMVPALGQPLGQGTKQDIGPGVSATPGTSRSPYPKDANQEAAAQPGPDQVHHGPLGMLQPDAAQARLGLAVSKKVEKRAVGRNRIKRQVRESFRAHQEQLAGLDIVVVANPPAAREDSAGLLASLERHWGRIAERLCRSPGQTPYGA